MQRVKVKMKYHQNYKLMPIYPRIPHLPCEPNAAADDLISSINIESLKNVYVEEKVDGANVRMAYSLFSIGNRDHILNKGYHHSNTTAQKQMASVWAWMGNRKKIFQRLAQLCDSEVTVYGEWCLYQHGIDYDNLPDKFIAYDVFDHDTLCFLPHSQALEFLAEAGFSVPQYVFLDSVDVEILKSLRDLQSVYCSYPQIREGIVIRSGEQDAFKMVSPYYVRNGLYNNKNGNKNSRWS